MPNTFVLVLTLWNVSHGIPHLICKWETSGEFHTMGLWTVNWSTNLFFPTRLIRLPAQTTMEIEIKLWNKRELLRGMHVLCWAHVIINYDRLVRFYGLGMCNMECKNLHSVDQTTLHSMCVPAVPASANLLQLGMSYPFWNSQMCKTLLPIVGVGNADIQCTYTVEGLIFLGV